MWPSIWFDSRFSIGGTQDLRGVAGLGLMALAEGRYVASAAVRASATSTIDVLCANRTRAWMVGGWRGCASVGRVARDSASVAGRVEGVPRVRCAPSWE